MSESTALSTVFSTTRRRPQGVRPARTKKSLRDKPLISESSAARDYWMLDWISKELRKPMTARFAASSTACVTLLQCAAMDTGNLGRWARADVKTDFESVSVARTRRSVISLSLSENRCRSARWLLLPSSLLEIMTIPSRGVRSRQRPFPSSVSFSPRSLRNKAGPDPAVPGKEE